MPSRSRKCANIVTHQNIRQRCIFRTAGALIVILSRNIHTVLNVHHWCMLRFVRICAAVPGAITVTMVRTIFTIQYKRYWSIWLFHSYCNALFRHRRNMLYLFPFCIVRFCILVLGLMTVSTSRTIFTVYVEHQWLI